MKEKRYTLREAAKKIAIPERQFFELLRELKIITKDNQPVLEYRKKGYLELKSSHFTHPVFGEQGRFSTVVTLSGLDFLNEVIQEKLKIDATRNEYKKCL